jgi:hypothetical protein
LRAGDADGAFEGSGGVHNQENNISYFPVKSYCY